LSPKAPMRSQSEAKAQPQDTDVISLWKQQYPLPDETSEGSRADVKRLYK